MMFEDILLRYSDQRHIHQLQKYLPRNFCEQAADAILAHPGKVLITTGFWWLHQETDGPIGAIVLADVLSAMGSDPVFVTDRSMCRNFTRLSSISSHRFSDCFTPRESGHCSIPVGRRTCPVILISIERGMSQDGRYYNMRRVDVSEHTAKIDYLFLEFPYSIGIETAAMKLGWEILRKKSRPKLCRLLPRSPACNIR